MYNQLKETLVGEERKDCNEYNQEKDTFLKRYKRFALEWYKEKQK